jgi:hypothetical protein
MSTKSPHGAHGCPCEDCLGDRISMMAELANRDRAPLPLWARQRGFRVRLAAVEMRRSRMPLTA